MTFYGICASCGRPVQAPEQPVFEIRGWEVLRTGGGSNQIRHRERIPDRVAHISCLDKLVLEERGGIQEELFR